MTKTVGYIRVSTQGQVRDGYSLVYQRDEIMRYCTNNSIELVQVYEDKGISGAKVDEDGLTYLCGAFATALTKVAGFPFRRLSSEMREFPWDETGLISFNLGIGLYVPELDERGESLVESVIVFRKGYYD